MVFFGTIGSRKALENNTKGRAKNHEGRQQPHLRRQTNRSSFGNKSGWRDYTACVLCVPSRGACYWEPARSRLGLSLRAVRKPTSPESVLSVDVAPYLASQAAIEPRHQFGRCKNVAARRGTAWPTSYGTGTTPLNNQDISCHTQRVPGTTGSYCWRQSWTFSMDACSACVAKMSRTVPRTKAVETKWHQ
jgi:hypothetical protein